MRFNIFWQVICKHEFTLVKFCSQLVVPADRRSNTEADAARGRRAGSPSTSTQASMPDHVHADLQCFTPHLQCSSAWLSQLMDSCSAQTRDGPGAGAAATAALEGVCWAAASAATAGIMPHQSALPSGPIGHSCRWFCSNLLGSSAH